MSSKKSFRRIMSVFTGKPKAPEHTQRTVSQYIESENNHFAASQPPAQTDCIPRSYARVHSDLPFFSDSENISDPSSGTWGSNTFGSGTGDSAAFQDALSSRSPADSTIRPSQGTRCHSSQPSVASSQDHMSRASRHSKDPEVTMRRLYSLCKNGRDNERAISMLDAYRNGNQDCWNDVLMTCVLITAESSNTDIMAALVARQGTLDSSLRNDEHETVLHIAARHGQLNMVDWLINHGADVNSKDNQRLMPDQLADMYNHQACAAVILAARAHPRSPKQISILSPSYHGGGYIQQYQPTQNHMYHQQHYQPHQQYNPYEHLPANFAPSPPPQSPAGWSEQQSKVQY